MKFWFLLSLTILIVDQSTKRFILSTLQPLESVALFPNLRLTLMFNEGAAFSFLSSAGGWQRWLFTGIALVVTVALTYWLLRLKRGEEWLAAGLALLIGGALGNLIDRILLGYVVDFIQISLPFIPLTLFNPWPAFNIADSAIVLGIVVLLVATLVTDDTLSKKSESKKDFFI